MRSSFAISGASVAAAASAAVAAAGRAFVLATAASVRTADAFYAPFLRLVNIACGTANNQPKEGNKDHIFHRHLNVNGVRQLIIDAVSAILDGNYAGAFLA